tara:strand:- start:93 stop:320 length:228 start_codon:yes stop_codon:yes gene_type:complete
MAMILPRVPKIKPNARDITEEYLERRCNLDNEIDDTTINEIATRNIQAYETQDRDDWYRINDWQDYPAERKLDFK